MAKWGEGDPRWIVEERSDAQNVNNWHWTESDASDWSKKELKKLLKGIKVETEEGHCQTTGVSKIEGEASVNNRKAKLICFYEWRVIIEWKGWIDNEDLPVRGTIEIPNFSEEYEPKELDVEVKLSNESDEDGYKLKQLMRTKGAKSIREAISQYVESLRTSYGKGLLLSRHTSVDESNSSLTPPTVKAKKEKSPIDAQPASTRAPMKVRTKKITLTEEFKTSADELYKTFTVKQRVEAFTNGSAEFAAERGGKFSLYGGNIKGQFLELIPNEKVVQTWRLKEWPDGHFSRVVLEFRQTEDSTELKLTQTGVPDFDLDRTIGGWKEKYWKTIKMTFGFGASLF
eukprot:m.10452 g.10452  ORF g.10452 m.10452 type:complete len:343 (+) comp22321_c0_seq1:150-1178(+)